MRVPPCGRHEHAAPDYLALARRAGTAWAAEHEDAQAPAALPADGQQNTLDVPAVETVSLHDRFKSVWEAHIFDPVLDELESTCRTAINGGLYDAHIRAVKQQAGSSKVSECLMFHQLRWGRGNVACAPTVETLLAYRWEALKVLGPRSEAKGVGSKAGAVSRHHLHVSEAAISKLGNGARLLGEAAHELDRYGGGRTELEVCLGVSGVSLF